VPNQLIFKTSQRCIETELIKHVKVTVDPRPLD